ncbi:MAG: FliO/MopB family protein [Burkholderiaceae bacterium]
MTPSLMPLLAFIAVIALIPLALWAMKRAGVGGVQTGNVLRPVANLSLGTSQRVAVVEIAVGAERHWLVLGVTGERVSQIASYAAPETPAQPAAPAHTLAVNQLIARWRGASGSQGDAHGR